MHTLQSVLDDLREETPDDVCVVVADSSPASPTARLVELPDQTDWVTFSELVDSGSSRMSDAVADFALPRMGDHRDAAVAHAAAWLTELMLWPMITSLVLRGRVWTFEPSTRLRRRPGTQWDVSRHTEATVAMTSDDVLAGSTVDGSIVCLPSAIDVAQWAGRRWAPTLRAVVDALRATGPYGRRGIWATIADEVVFAALVAAHRVHRDDERALTVALAFLDEVKASTGESIPRPPIQTVEVTIGSRRSPIKATCCLRYKVPDFASRVDPLCLTCPKRPADESARLSTAWVERLCSGG